MRTMTTFTANRDAFANLVVLLLFPGFFFYHTLIGTGALPAVLGGYFSPMCAAVLPFLLILYFNGLSDPADGMQPMDIAFIGFLIYFFFVAAFNLADGAQLAVFKHHLISIFHFLVVFLAFRMADLGKPRFRQLSLLCLVAMTVTIFYMSADGLFYLKQLGESEDADSVATYQGFARSYFVVFVILLSAMRSRLARAFFYLAGAVALFLNGARSELIALLFSAIAIEYVRARHKLPVLAFLVLLFIPAVVFMEVASELLPHNRSAELLNLSASHSWEMRTMLSQHALSSIAAHPVFGDYGSYFQLFGNAGSYAHNMLSAWVDLGLTGFVYLLCLLTIPLYSLVADIHRPPGGEADERVLVFCLTAVMLLLLATSKSFTYVLIAAAAGRYALYQSRRKHDQGRAPDHGAFPGRYPDFHQAVPQPGIARI